MSTTNFTPNIVINLTVYIYINRSTSHIQPSSHLTLSHIFIPYTSQTHSYHLRTRYCHTVRTPHIVVNLYISHTRHHRTQHCHTAWTCSLNVVHLRQFCKFKFTVSLVQLVQMQVSLTAKKHKQKTQTKIFPNIDIHIEKIPQNTFRIIRI